MGNNLNNRLGINDQTLAYSSVPHLVESLAACPVAKVSCGWTHTAAVTGTLGVMEQSRERCSHGGWESLGSWDMAMQG